jgi:hypothetical protein
MGNLFAWFELNFQGEAVKNHSESGVSWSEASAMTLEDNRGPSVQW